ncbi:MULTISPECIES: DNA uptake porin HofQ [Candidatus Williamhamiltonella]|uniref:DNA transporter HofQ n=1 Tax=Candidatus Williamhamiltonella defendens TaxID=138072 RepID=A0A2D3TFJ7_9ENTR|nr:DNA uptake porin HofQ [Candidatus Hamiltonella defensa]ATW34281.1 DNA transporter HofQ [Candidatus Hamiltonella defensa]
MIKIIKIFIGAYLFLLSSLSFSKEQKDIFVNMEFKDTPVVVILQALADYQKLNLVIAKGVQGNLSLRLIEVPWSHALDVILRMSQLRIERKDNILMVFTEQEIINKQIEKLQIKKEKKSQSKKMNYLIFTFQHADSEEVAKNLSANRGFLLSQEGNVIADKRTNNLFIHDTAQSLAGLTKWLKEIDSPLRQIELSAHIVTMSSENLYELGIRWGMNALEKGNPLGIKNFNINLPLKNTAIAANFQVASINSRLLDLELSALEQENQVDIIASPRLITSHQQTASIKQGTDIPYQINGKKENVSIEFKEAVLGMEVTPTILGNDKIRLKLKISQNMPGMAIKRGDAENLAIDKQEITTHIIVKHGETIVLGGIFQKKNNHRIDKVPGFGNIPFLGALFRQDVNQQRRRELVIFITPKLIH